MYELLALKIYYVLHPRISPRSVDRADRDIAREASAANETNGIDRASEGWIARAAR